MEENRTGHNTCIYERRPILDEVLFPIGRMVTNCPCEVCKICGKVRYEKRLYELRYENFERIKIELLRARGLDYESNPDAYMDEFEFALVNRTVICDKDRDWYLKGIFGHSEGERIFFLRDAVEYYRRTDGGMFWLVDREELIRLEADPLIVKNYGCFWCSVGTRTHLRNNTSCSYCG